MQNKKHKNQEIIKNIIIDSNKNIQKTEFNHLLNIGISLFFVCVFMLFLTKHIAILDTVNIKSFLIIGTLFDLLFCFGWMMLCQEYIVSKEILIPSDVLVKLNNSELLSKEFKQETTLILLKKGKLIYGDLPLFL